jgi:FkbM family methyltransferase
MAIQQVRSGQHIYAVELIDAAGVSVAAEIFKHKEYRRAEAVIKETRDVIVDVGAHVGLFAIYCRSLNPNSEIICLEPEEKNFNTLRDNVNKNKITNVVVLKAALAHVSGRRYLGLSEDSHNHELFPENACESGRCDLVETFSLGALLKNFEIKKIGLLKMDIEGAETEILLSLDSEIFAKISAIIMEYHDTRGRTHSNLEAILRENGFGVEVFPSKFDKNLGFIFARNKRI